MARLSKAKRCEIGTKSICPVLTEINKAIEDAATTPYKGRATEHAYGEGDPVRNTRIFAGRSKCVIAFFPELRLVWAAHSRFNHRRNRSFRSKPGFAFVPLGCLLKCIGEGQHLALREVRTGNH